MVKAPAGVAGYRPHDLLWPLAASSLVFSGPPPPWATPDWLAVAPVVVRRATLADPAQVPVGLRGATRSERCAAWMAAGHAVRVLKPEEIARSAAGSARVRESPLACLQALARLGPAFDALPLAWGVTGGVGFSLASGFDVLRPDSDLDLILRAPLAADADALRAVAQLLRDLEARVDAQVETPFGAFALQEWVRTGGPVLLKTHRGPVLTDNAWSSPDSASFDAACRPMPA
ncbi:malonate decarboxylase holo-ACP synthase [Polaromonas naphthalenivorans]|uniref:malonate decarboxylase holo-ACP synthase n=1 Tax=Polaromonas naphthalenivorans TaxID=216465 RepID=UPI000067F0D3|nr:malonate decarboxylase holo-ACP synthase [Polaromonas naphthalenivorans]